MLKWLRGLNWPALSAAALFVVVAYGAPCLLPQRTQSHEAHLQKDNADSTGNQAKRANSNIASVKKPPAASETANSNKYANRSACLPRLIWERLELLFGWLFETPEAFWAGCVALFTCLLVWRAIRQEQATIALERAYLFVTVHIGDVNVPAANGSPFFVPRAWAVIKNHGKTPAFLTLLRGYLAEHKEYPRALIDPVITRPIPDGIVIGADDEYRLDLSDDLFPLIPADPLVDRLLALGLVEYRDIFGKARKTGYCWQYQDLLGVRRFQIAPADHLNYHD